MNKHLLSIGFGIAVVIGGIYLYQKYGRGKQKDIVKKVGGTYLGNKIGEIAGLHLAGPAGAIVGSVVGAVGAAIATENMPSQS